MRTCNTCGRELPVSEFWADTKTGYPYRRCKVCDNDAHRSQRAGMRDCRRCKRFLPAEEFPKGKKDQRRRRVCNACRSPEGATACVRCGVTKPNTEFAGEYSYCKACSSEVNRERLLRALYSMSPEDFELKVKQQGGGCALCGEQVKLHIDHDHECCPTVDRARNVTCGRCVRGLLCEFCNRGLGMFRDNAELLRKAADYLDSWKAVLPEPELFPLYEVARLGRAAA